MLLRIQPVKRGLFLHKIIRNSSTSADTDAETINIEKLKGPKVSFQIVGCMGVS